MHLKPNSFTCVLTLTLLAGLALGNSLDVIIDNGDPYTSFTGTWGVSGAAGAWGVDSLWARGGATYTWRPQQLDPGEYEVFMWWTQLSSRTDAAPVTIVHSAGTTDLVVNQQINGGQWNSLGTYHFPGYLDGTGSVTITALGAYPVSTCADAVRFLRSSAGSIVFNDGQTHEISTLVINDYRISDGPSSEPTTLNITSSGQVGAFDPPTFNEVLLFEHSILNIWGQTLWGFTASGKSKVNFYEGSGSQGFSAGENSRVDIYGGEIYTFDEDRFGDLYGVWWITMGQQAQVYLHNGTISGHMVAHQNSRFIMNGGVIGGERGYLEAHGQAQIELNGGSLRFLECYDDAQVTLNGGVVSRLDTFSAGVIRIKGGNCQNLALPGYDDAVISQAEIYGTAFNLPFGEVTAPSGTIRGTLENGDYLNMAFTKASTCKIILIDSSSPPVETIIDNTDTALTSRVGTWSVSGAPNPYGTDSLYCRKANCSFTWHFTPAETGNYYVYMWWTEFSSRSTDVPVEIETAGGTQYLTVNQRGDGGKWNVLGNDDYAFNAGTTYKITVRTLTDNTTVCADAVRFAPAGDREVVYADGLTHEINLLVPYDYRVYDGPTGQPTTLNITESGQVGTYEPLSWNTVSVFEHSILNISGRLSWGFDANDDSRVNMYSGYSYAFGVSGNSRLDIYGGSVVTGLPWGMDFAAMAGNSQVYLHDGIIESLLAGGSSRFIMNGGAITHLENGGTGQIQAYEQSRIEINAGSVGGSIEARGQSRIEINGGSVGSLVCLDDAQAQINGGSVTGLGAYSTGTVTIKGGNVQNLTVGSESDSAVATVEIYGSAFNLPFGEVAALSGTITGTLENGDSLNMPFTRNAASKILLIQSASEDIIIDNGDPGTSFTGTWGVSGATGAYGTDSLWARGGATYTWQTSLPAGFYEVFMWWTQYSSRTSAAPVAVVHAGGTENLTVNQRTNGAEWNSLGTYYFDGTGSVTITAVGVYPVSTCADAVRFVQVIAPPEPDIIIDNTDAATQHVGTWSVSGGADPYGPDSLYCRDANRSFTWLFTPAEAGFYDVSMWWTEFVSRSTVTPVEIQHAAGTAFMTVNQRTNGGIWNILGQYQFQAGVTYNVTVRTLADRSAVCADAVKFSKVVN